MTEPLRQRHAGRRVRSVAQGFDEGKEWADPMSDDNRIMAIRHYLHNGWSIVPLHDVHNGPCSCGNPRNDANHDFKQGGKHPIAARWQLDENLITSEADAIAYWRDSPDANIGLATGRTFWVLDEDTYNGADLDALIGERDWPRTFTTRTGGGGRQHYFTLPDFVVTAGMAKRLPQGFDVRGMGGQVVAPPSVSGKGAYSVLDGAPVAAAPTWLLDMIREPERQSHDVPPSPAEFQASGSARAIAYVKAAMARETAAFSALVDGRQQEAYPFACRMIELANLAGMPVIGARDWYLQACEQAASNGERSGLTRGEALRIWGNAERHVGERCAEMGPPPPSPFGDLPTRPFGVAVNGDGYVSHDVPPSPNQFQTAGQDADDWATLPPLDPFDEAVKAEAWKIKVRDEARRRVALEAGAGLPDAVAALRARLLTRAGLRDIPALTPLIHGVLYRDTFVRLVGASGHGKTFAALSLAGALASGTPWAGHVVPERGRVLYIVAEGAAGMDKRVSALEREIGHDLDGVTFLPMPVQARSPEWDTLVELCRQEKPDLIIGDTQARLTVGVNENDASEMGEVVDAMERLRVATGACVMLVHHTGHQGEHGRGSTAVRAACQTELLCTRRGDQVTVTDSKQKDDVSDTAYVFTMTRVVVGTDLLGEVASVVLRHVPGVVARDPDVMISDEELKGHEGKLALLLGEVFAGANGGTKAEVFAAVRERKLITAKTTWFRAWNACVDGKIVGRLHGTQSWRYVPPERRKACDEPLPKGAKGYYHPGDDG